MCSHPAPGDEEAYQALCLFLSDKGGTVPLLVLYRGGDILTYL